jgi:hypothetical protein
LDTAGVEYFNWKLFDHPPYRPVLIPSNHHLFAYLKSWLGSQSFNKNEELMVGVKMWLIWNTHKNFIPYTTNAIPAVTMLRSSVNMYAFLYVIIFYLIVCFVNYSRDSE